MIPDNNNFLPISKIFTLHIAGFWGTKLERFLHKNQHTQRKLLNFELNQKGSDDFWHRKTDYESQILALFDSSPLIQNSKFNNFLWAYWFLCKNLSNFVPPAWKLHNPYCHNEYATEFLLSFFRTTVRRNFDPYLHFFQLMLSCDWFKEV